jgi:hypothetical protein
MNRKLADRDLVRLSNVNDAAPGAVFIGGTDINGPMCLTASALAAANATFHLARAAPPLDWRVCEAQISQLTSVAVPRRDGLFRRLRFRGYNLTAAWFLAPHGAARSAT